MRELDLELVLDPWSTLHGGDSYVGWPAKWLILERRHCVGVLEDSLRENKEDDASAQVRGEGSYMIVCIRLKLVVLFSACNLQHAWMPEATIIFSLSAFHSASWDLPPFRLMDESKYLNKGSKDC